MQKRAPSAACPMCGELDHPSHFLACKVINGSEEWKELKVSFQTRAGVRKVPGFLVRSALLTMEGETVNSEVQVGVRREIYKGQEEIRWSNFIRGRVHKKWHTLQKRGAGDEPYPSSAWQYNLVESVLELLMNKWNLRCKKVKIEELEVERLRCMEEYEEIIQLPEWRNLGEGDAYLAEERSRPSQGIPLGILKELVRTCRSARQAAARQLL